MTASASLPFDRVVIQTAEGVSRLTVDEFMAISLRQRVQHILGNQLNFFSATSRWNRR